MVPFLLRDLPWCFFEAFDGPRVIVCLASLAMCNMPYKVRKIVKTSFTISAGTTVIIKIAGTRVGDCGYFSCHPCWADAKGRGCRRDEVEVEMVELMCKVEMMLSEWRGLENALLFILKKLEILNFIWNHGFLFETPYYFLYLSVSLLIPEFQM